MGGFSKLAAEATDKTVTWLASLANKLGRTPDELQAEIGEKTQKLAEQAPEMFEIYDQPSLYTALQEASEGSADLALMNPKTFEQLAAGIDMSDPMVRYAVLSKQNQLQNLMLDNTLLDDIPHLTYDLPAGDSAVQIRMHDGRHRNRALDAEGNPVSLVRMVPVSNEKSLKKVDPSATVYDEISHLQIPSRGGRNIGTLGDLMKFLSIGGVTTTGALSQLPSDQNGGKVE